MMDVCDILNSLFISKPGCPLKFIAILAEFFLLITNPFGAPVKVFGELSIIFLRASARINLDE
jgi:hypothetical protein